MIFSFGGDRETFNFFDPFNHLNVDNDVWKFSYPKKYSDFKLRLHKNYPNPFKNKTTLNFELPSKGKANLKIYNLSGKLVQDFNLPNLDSGKHQISWNGKNLKGYKIKRGLYILKLNFKGKSLSKYMVKK